MQDLLSQAEKPNTKFEQEHIDILKKCQEQGKENITWKDLEKKHQAEFLKELIKQDPLQERNINWTNFLEYLTSEDGKLIKAYWFKAEKILEHTWGSPSPEEKIWLHEKKKEFAAQRNMYHNMANKHAILSIEEAGYLKVHPHKKVIQEKGIDVALTVRMLHLAHQNKCDKIILISGDADYIPVFKYLEEDHKDIQRHVVAFKAGNPPKKQNFSAELGYVADKTIPIYEYGDPNQEDFRKKGLRDFLDQPS